MLALWYISDFRRLWLGQLASVLGTWLLVVAAPLYVFDLTGSSAATGGTFIAETLPALVVGPAAGVLVDRLDRRRVMIGAELVRAAAVLSMLFVTGRSLLWVLYAALLAENAAAQFFRPARQALIPALLGTQVLLPQANAMFWMIDGLVRLLGSVLGGALYLAIGFPGLVLANAASYLASAYACHRLDHRPGRHPQPARITVGRARAELRAALSHIQETPTLRRLLWATGVFYLANGVVTALLVPYARTALHVGPAAFGYLLAALGAGYVVGTLSARRVIARLSALGAVMGSVPLVAACYLLAFQPQTYPTALIGFAAAGAPAVVLLVAVQTECQIRTPDALLGRVTAVYLTVEMLVSVTGAALGSVLADRVGVLSMIDLALLVLGALGVTLPQPAPSRRPVPRRSRTAA